jgi:hypothetical protein
MAMFNYVKLKSREGCPLCGSVLDNWQTKSMVYAGYDLANTSQTLRLDSRMTGEVHTVCDVCLAYVSMTIVKGRVVARSLQEPAGRLGAS